MTLLLKIVTPIGITLEKEVASVVLPASGGEIEILPGHLPLLTIIQPGELVAKNTNSQEFFAIDFGFALISNDTVFVLTDESLNIDEADLSEIEEAEERAKKALEEARSKREVLDPAEIEKLDAKVKYQMAKKLAKIRH
ncbi:MAG: ATP synthase F1 subunit epsilon [Puniceicoccales bacterium]|jgi:F-type H+-transporting ATPase subunit epsilon|nr:ATP synthase F1 subunit epsilon [Puniceicoccales bacterium]